MVLFHELDPGRQGGREAPHREQHARDVGLVEAVAGIRRG